MVQTHLDDCAECRMYFERMSRLLERPESSDLPRLEPDPFLPARIRAMADDSSADRARATAPGRAIAKPLGWLRLSSLGVMFVVAVAAGVYLGQSIALPRIQNGDSQLVSSYYEAFSQSSFADDWEQLLDTDNKEL
jgi:predicted anti-sigma-YlaC factor YlaD